MPIERYARPRRPGLLLNTSKVAEEVTSELATSTGDHSSRPAGLGSHRRRESVVRGGDDGSGAHELSPSSPFPSASSSSLS